MDGTWDCPKVSGAITANQRLYWDATADPVGGTAGSGALTATAGATKPFAGIAAAAAANTDGKVKLLLNRVAPKAANVAAEATANGSDAATTQALANALKTKVNAILTALKDAGLMATA